MVINSVRLSNFRCFDEQTFNFNHSTVLIEGNNGAGKTSLLEALYYAGYLKSFRSRLSSDLIKIGAANFFLKLDVTDAELNTTHTIEIGCQKGTKTVKLDGKALASHQDLHNKLRVVSLTEDDIDLVRGLPALRRTFLNETRFLCDHEVVNTLRKYKKILEQRNKLLMDIRHQSSNSGLRAMLKAWTQQLWTLTITEQAERKLMLIKIEAHVNQLVQKSFPREDITISFKYQMRNMPAVETFEEFWNLYEERIFDVEQSTGYTAFGLHLDDFSVTFQGKLTKGFASRGQNKLVVFLMKIAQMLVAGERNVCLILDDFLTDFDQSRLEGALELIKQLAVQVFVTTPLSGESFKTLTDVQLLKL